MPFPYRYICDLLQQLDDEAHKLPSKQIPSDQIIADWFQKHCPLLNAPGNDVSVVFSTLLPERRTDRVYGIQAPKLQSIFGKALQLGATRVQELRRWTTPGSGIDLADCIESILRQTSNSLDDTTHSTVEEIDETLGKIAATCRFSSPAVKNRYSISDLPSPNTLLANIYTRIGSRDAKWFTRLVLKNYQPVELKTHTVFRNYHPLLPTVMKIRDDLSLATAYVRDIDRESGVPNPTACSLKPCLGTKVGRQEWFKGRSIKHCLNMAQGREVVCEQKIDGEYCQVHVNLDKPDNYIQIFSKSGKDSTADRIGLHGAIHESLKIGDKDCPLAKGCILEGELVVYSTKENRVLPFRKIRKHVSRSGSFLGTSNDSQAYDHEHLMIIYYDVLLIDGVSLLGVKNSERFRRLSEIVTCRQGCAELVSRTAINTSRPSAARILRELFAQCIASCGEGLVVKPDESYFNLSTKARRYSCCNIKLKKEYFQGLGDVGDFAVVGASYDATKAKEYKTPKATLTHFFIGCFENKHQVQAKAEIPRFRITNIVELTGPVLSAFWAQGRPIMVPYEDNNILRISNGEHTPAKKPTFIFPCPLVFDMRSFAFDKEPNTNFWSMRFPQVSKIHHDRSYLDTITFSELQEIAEAAMRVPEEEDSQEMLRWIKTLEKMEPRKFSADDSSQATACSDADYSSPSPTPSSFTPRRPGPNLPMPPTASAIEGAMSTGTDPTISATSVSSGTKRPMDQLIELGHARKCRRGRSGLSSVGPSQETSLLESSTQGSRSHREPLAQVDLNLPKESSIRSQPPLSAPTQDERAYHMENPAASSPTAHCTAFEIASLPPGTAAKRRQGPAMGENPSNANDPGLCCSVNGHECALASCSILLSPCISSYACVTELLRRHGIVDPLLDPRVWNNVDAWTRPSRSKGDREHGSAPTDRGEMRRRIIRKICLVESKRKEATEAFLQKIKDVDLRKKDGKREWVAVYDWRVLESITKQESRDSSLQVTDPWRQFYVGIV